MIRDFRVPRDYRLFLNPGCNLAEVLDAASDFRADRPQLHQVFFGNEVALLVDFLLKVGLHLLHHNSLVSLMLVHRIVALIVHHLLRLLRNGGGPHVVHYRMLFQRRFLGVGDFFGRGEIEGRLEIA